VIVLGEYRYGIASSRYRDRYEAWLLAHLDAFTILPVTTETTSAYAEIRVELKRRGQAIPANDAWIAALARQYHLSILSRDTHFDVVSGIHRLSW
jgi:predicted nucleic acid-binding protein